MIEEKYKIGEKGFKIECYRKLLEYIVNKSMFQYFQLQNQGGKKKNYQRLPTNTWHYVKGIKENQLSVKGMNPIFWGKQDGVNKFGEEVKDRIKKMKELGIQYRNILDEIGDKYLEKDA